MVAVPQTRQSLATYFGTLGNWIGAATADPGTTQTPANEVTGGTPAYARKQTTWTPGTGGSNQGSKISLDIPSGTTVTHVIIASAAAVASANMIDKAAITSITFSTQGILDVTPSYTQT